MRTSFFELDGASINFSQPDGGCIDAAVEAAVAEAVEAAAAAAAGVIRNGTLNAPVRNSSVNRNATTKSCSLANPRKQSTTASKN
jgi:hypothetical protein